MKRCDRDEIIGHGLKVRIFRIRIPRIVVADDIMFPAPRPDLFLHRMVFRAKGVAISFLLGIASSSRLGVTPRNDNRLISFVLNQRPDFFHIKLKSEEPLYLTLTTLQPFSVPYTL